MSKIYTLNNKIVIINNKWAQAVEETPPAPTFDEVTIGTQTWMASNLAIDDGGAGISIIDNVTVNGINFGTQYYYTWDAAVRVASSISGWHLPSKSEWETLLTTAGGTSTAGYKLKSRTGWEDGNNGIDTYGFSAPPVGYYISGSMGGEGVFAVFWTNTTYDSSQSYIKGFQMSDAVFETYSGKSNGMTIRLIKDS